MNANHAKYTAGIGYISSAVPNGIYGISVPIIIPIVVKTVN
ncbi:hypothetical protein SDC9_138558 [bioreactor metagenome]|uniref:Uncharacterized protein n=1 Tax=bioreactor metagenome TaxID=1076179 RepID=A0A645DQA2_9ZZZZ